MALGTCPEVLQPQVELTETKIVSLCSENKEANPLGLGPHVSGCISECPAVTTYGKPTLICAESPWEDSGAPQNEDPGGGKDFVFDTSPKNKSTEKIHPGKMRILLDFLYLVSEFSPMLSSILRIFSVLGLLKSRSHPGWEQLCDSVTASSQALLKKHFQICWVV